MLRKAVLDAYRTYRGDSALHRVRLLVAFGASITVAVAGVDLERSTFQVSSLVITVLAGFVFTALFSNYSVTTAGLEAPRDETDRSDIALLKILGENFSSRSKYFLILALTDLILIILLTTQISISKLYYIQYIIEYYDFINTLLGWIILVFKIVFKSAAIFLFLECVYTFYRLAETILSVLDIRKSYANSRLK